MNDWLPSVGLQRDDEIETWTGDGGGGELTSAEPEVIGGAGWLAGDRGSASWSSREISVGNYGWRRGGSRHSMSDTGATLSAALAPQSRKLSIIREFPARGHNSKSRQFTRASVRRVDASFLSRGKSEPRGSRGDFTSSLLFAS